MRKKEAKKRKDPEHYCGDLVYVPNIENLAEEKCPLIPLAMPTGDTQKDNDSLIMTIRAISENKGFIKGYEYAISIVKEMMNNAINDTEEDVIKNVFNKLIDF